MNSIVNISSYKFVTLDNLAARRTTMRDFAKSLQLKGTILLTPEGINMFLAGSRESIDTFLANLRSQNEFHDLETKESVSDRQPFRRLLVKIKKEIITFGVDGIEPAKRTSPKLSATELKQWLDDGKPVQLLDVRNDYEVELGTFRGAVPIGIDHFRSFPEAVQKLPDAMKDLPVVMFCTGGIRCEKAGPYMEQAGFQHVYQLDGGILKYFEQCGGDHYDGDCFVFDQRVTLNPALEETDVQQCFACQHPLTLEDQASAKYVASKSCPYCYQPPEVILADVLERRHQAIDKMVSPLPGSQPYENVRPMNVPQRYDGLTTLDFLDALHPHFGKAAWRTKCDSGLIRRRSQTLDANAVVRAGDRIEHVLPQTVEPDVNGQIRILHEDDALVVVNKPAPLPMHPCGRFNRNSLISILNEVYRPQVLRMCHRLDANTAGVVLLAKNRNAARMIQSQFENGTAKKKYWAMVHGVPSADQFACDARITDKPSASGGRKVVESDGLTARTEFTVLKRLENGTSLVEARPLTGRTNQIRVHLAHLGFPICGDPIYANLSPDFSADAAHADLESEAKQTLDVTAPPLCLHSIELTVQHPLTRDPVTFRSESPAWLDEVSF
ncbi:MAG: sulfurtransferase [Pirellulaceae bacterium]